MAAITVGIVHMIVIAGTSRIDDFKVNVVGVVMSWLAHGDSSISMPSKGRPEQISTHGGN